MLHSHDTRNTTQGDTDLDRYLAHVHGDARYFVSVCTNDRTKPERTGWDEGPLIPYYAGGEATIARRIASAVDDGLDVYMPAHGYRDRNGSHKKDNAALIACLWVERDAATIPPDVPQPTLTVETSPGRYQDYWRLPRSVAAERAEQLNRRLTQRIGGDSGWALTKRLRPPGTRNFKYADAPDVRILAIDDERTVDPDELDRLLPPIADVAVSAGITAGAMLEHDGDEPPVALSPEALAVWRGERPVVKNDGSGVIDRSDSLYRIACELWEHGATRRTVAAELAERDRALGWNRYSDRPVEYERLAAKVAAKPRRVAPIAPPTLVAHQSAPHADTAEIEQLRTENAQLRAERDDARCTLANAIQTMLNPHLVQSQKLALIGAISAAEQKRRNGDVRPDGSVELNAAEISDDWRPEPTKKGESLPPTNPTGSKPRMPRSCAKPVMVELTERGIMPATPRSVFKPRANGATYEDTVWDVALPDKISDVLARAAAWRPEEPKVRKARSRPTVCQHCGEVHPIHRRDYCGGCGELRAERTIEPAEQVDAVPDYTDAEVAGKNIRQLVESGGVVVTDAGKTIRHSHPADSAPQRPALVTHGRPSPRAASPPAYVDSVPF